MIRILIGVVLLLSLACTTVDTNHKYVDVKYNIGDETYKLPYQVIIIDSCEYILSGIGNYSWGSHKGNCKFCVERLKKMGDTCGIHHSN